MTLRATRHHLSDRMAFISSGSDVLRLLAARTHCGLVFDRLDADELVQHQAFEDDVITLQWQGHHRSPEMAPWAVRWSNTKHHITLVLQPSPGAWAFARCYFDRLPLPLAQALVADIFQPFWAGFQDGPWLPVPTEPYGWVDGGAHIAACSSTQNLGFGFELAFSSASAASALVESFAQPKRGVDVADMVVPCEIELGSLQLSLARIQALRTGDVVLGSVQTSNAQTHVESSLSQLARLRGGCMMRTLAMLRRHDGCWKVADVQPSILSESPMEDNEFFPDQDLDAADPDYPQKSAAPIDWSDLKIKVEIVASRLSLSVAAIQKLRPGDVLEMTHALGDAQIDIRVGGRRYASGTLIALEGQLAVQITKINGLHEPSDSANQGL